MGGVGDAGAVVASRVGPDHKREVAGVRQPHRGAPVRRSSRALPRRSLAARSARGASPPRRTLAKGRTVSAGRSHRRRIQRGSDARYLAFVVPPVPSGAPEPVRQVFRWRQQATILGVCPSCDARRSALPPRVRAGAVVRVAMDHESWCPVSDAGIDELIAQHGWEPGRGHTG